MEKFIFGSFEYNYELIPQKRKTLSLTVTPSLKIILKSPLEADLGRRELFLRRKWFWLEKQLSFFKKYQRKIYKKEYVSGESFLYLGRQYRLLAKKAKDNRVTLEKGRITINTTKNACDGDYNKKLLNEWYDKKMKAIFLERITAINSKFDYKQQPALLIKKMNKRWGSYLKSNKIILNPKLIYVSKDCIDYVITHELCHCRYKNHDKKFYLCLSKKYPNWKKIKEKLEVIGSTVN
jgi:hypothetical protein